jgi:flavin reductase (DIM6/NTAB) family NADH-FMN oxidoreductase RutF
LFIISLALRRLAEKDISHRMMEEPGMKRSLGAKTLACPAPVWLVGTYDKEGKPNAMTAAWGGICCSRPPCVTVSLRKATYTYGSLIERKAFTISIPPETYAAEADYFGIASGRNVNKFSITGLTAVKSEIVDAPYIQEFPLVLECALLHVLEVDLHTMFVGEIKDVKADETIIGTEGHLEMKKLEPFVFDTGTKSYYGIGERLGQAFSIGMDKYGG